MSTVAGSNHSSISDDELDQLLREILRVSPHSGEVVLIGALRGRGIQIQRSRLRQAIRRVDPIGRTLRRSRTIVRRTYSVAGPNELWHLDGNHKLIRWRRFDSDAVSVRGILAEDVLPAQNTNILDPHSNGSSDNEVHVPLNQLSLSEEQVTYVTGVVSHLPQEDHTGRYIAVRRAVHGLSVMQ
ncbi:hypothetical protein BSL78_17924 [Apostichopus japonicus]|uniref:Integrase core domain-containing protein n=1 Tax=Stichopus japonicus TaxID=307972 RepID=A0A2G8KB46_STIJA|nr:hypothetical protein BSL78_17924 [Apostichopus japonicus]